MSLPYKRVLDRTELAWAAGFFDAEGWAAAVKSRGGTRPMAQINQADAFGVPEVLERFHAAVGVGRVRGPKRAPGRIDLYHWVVSSSGDVRSAFAVLSPWLGAVKRVQFVEAVGVMPAADFTPSHDEELAWAAGLFDGDGSTCLERHKTRSNYRRAHMTITQASRAGVPQVLARFRELIGVGHTNGPYGGTAKWEPVYRWKAHRLVDVQNVARTLWPWLGSVKRAQALDVIAVVAAQAALPRGNPAWGSHKVHCVRGHEYASVRIRPYRARAGGSGPRRPSKQCLACVREYARHNRASKKARRSS